MMGFSINRSWKEILMSISTHICLWIRCWWSR